MPRTRAAPPASVGKRCSCASRRRASRKKGLPPVASRHAAANSGATAAPSLRSHSVAVASVLSGRGPIAVVSGAAASRAMAPVSPSPGRVVASTAIASPSNRGAR
jgi:hypothetical protein